MGFLLKREQLLEAVQLVKERVDKNITVISDVIKRGADKEITDMEYRGSGCYFSYNGFPFILTAKHVVDYQNVDFTVHGTKAGERAFPLRSVWVSDSNQETDIAIYGCFQNTLDLAGVVPFSYNELLVPSFQDEQAFYYCNGFPQANMVDLPFMGETSFVGNSFVGQQTSLPKGYDEDTFFAVHYPCETNPQGMSGSPIWNLRFHCMDKMETWSPDAVTFAGVVHTWHKDTQKLIASKVDVISGFIPSGLRFLKDKFNWIDAND